MKHYKSTGILFLLVALVAGYAYFVEYKGKIQKEEQETQAKKIIPFSLEETTEFKIKTQTSEHVFKKVTDESGTKWFLEKPVQDIANYGAVQGFLAQFGAEGYEEVAAEGNVDLSIYGLNENPNTLTFTRKKDGQDEVVMIEVGTASAIGGKKYLRINGQDKVLIASFFWETQLQKNFSELREKNFIPPEFSIQTIAIQNKEKLHFEQKDAVWVLEELGAKDPDRSAIDDIYYQIKNLRASQIFKEGKNPSDVKNLGLLEPEITIDLSNGAKQITLQFSKNLLGQVYAISSERDVIFSLNPPAVKPFLKVAEDFRDKKKPLSFNVAEVEELDFRSSLTNFKLKKENNEWKSTETLNGMEVDNSKVVDILSKLSMMKVKKYFDQDVNYQKSGMTELKLKTSKGDKVLELEWSARPLDDVFVAKSNLSEKTFGLSMEDVSSLPFQAVIKEIKEPKVDEKAQEKVVQ